MAEPAVANASPLIFLARGGRFDLLRLTGDRVLVLPPVAVEIRRRGSEDVTARALDAAAWIEIVDPPAVPSVISAWDLGPGESAVLTWAHAHPGCEAIVETLRPDDVRQRSVFRFEARSASSFWPRSGERSLSRGP